MVVLGFNSHDFPLIRSYLSSSLMKAKIPPQFVIKLKFLDITNYLAAGTSLDKFYKSYKVSTPKGHFPYRWFDTLDKLQDISLPGIDEFHRILTKTSISTEEHQHCTNIWTREGIKTFGDYVKYYNNVDVIGFVEVVENIMVNERDNKLDMFKESISLPYVDSENQ